MTHDNTTQGRRPDTIKCWNFKNHFREIGWNYTAMPQYFKERGQAHQPLPCNHGQLLVLCTPACPRHSKTPHTPHPPHHPWVLVQRSARNQQKGPEAPFTPRVVCMIMMSCNDKGHDDKDASYCTREIVLHPLCFI